MTDVGGLNWPMSAPNFGGLTNGVIAACDRARH
jgi:hypothetical protein